jgi:WD40 repeat protein
MVVDCTNISTRLVQTDQQGTYLALSRDGKLLAAPNIQGYDSSSGKWVTDNTVALWDVLSGKRLILLGHTDKVLDIAFSPDGSTIATASVDNSVKLWNTR